MCTFLGARRGSHVWSFNSSIDIDDRNRTSIDRVNLRTSSSNSMFSNNMPKISYIMLRKFTFRKFNFSVLLLL